MHYAKIAGTGLIALTLAACGGNSHDPRGVDRAETLLSVSATGEADLYPRLGRTMEWDTAAGHAVLRGAGGIFASGANVKVMAGLDAEGGRAFITSLFHAIDAVRCLPVPVICVLQGHCYGAAMELAAACDMRVADTTLVSGMPEVRVGIPSVIQACLLPRLIGWGRTSELLLTGRDVEGTENMAIGFVERQVPPDALHAAVGDWEQAILSCAPAAVRSQKAVMRGWESDESPGVQASIDAFAAAYLTGEPAQYMPGPKGNS